MTKFPRADSVCTVTCWKWWFSKGAWNFNVWLNL